MGVDQHPSDLPVTDITARTDRLPLNGLNNRADFSEATYFLTAHSLEELLGPIREGMGRYGIDSSSAEGWIASISRWPENKSDFAIGPGTSTGLEGTYFLGYDGSKDTQISIVHVNPMPTSS